MKTIEIFRKIPKSLLDKFSKNLQLEDSLKGKRLQDLAKIVIQNISNQEVTKSELIEQLPISYRKSMFQKDMHDLLSVLLEFLAKEELTQNPIVFQRLKIDSILKYDLEELFYKSFVEGNKIIEENLLIDNDYNLERYLYEKKIFHEPKFWNNGKLSREVLMIFRKIINNYFTSQLIEKSKIQQLINTTSFAISDKDSLRYISIDSDQHTKDLLRIHQGIYGFLSSKKIELARVNEIILLIKDLDNLTRSEFDLILNNLNNVFVRQSNSGSKDFDKSCFELYKIAIDRNHYRNIFNSGIYRNIIFYACQAKEFDWALNFSAEYRFKLPKEEQETAYSFNKARIYQNMGSYEKVVETLRDVEYKDITYNLNSKLMLMGAFYELDEYETLISKIRAFKVFLRRRRNISVKRKANFTDFCDALYNIIMAEEKRDKKRITKALAIIDANPAIPNTGWLKKKIEEVGL